MSKKPLDLQAVREHLAANNGQQYWRSLEQLAKTESFQEFMEREFPRHAAEMRDPLTRRNFLKLTAASLALAGLTGCAIREPRGKIVPYVRLPEQVIPGRPLFFTSAAPIRGYALGVMAESHEGRPTKVEGNLQHPASLGATDIFTQASILTMYDPDRSQQVRNAGQDSTWENFVAAAGAALAEQQANGGAGLRLLTETVTSPTLASQIEQLLSTYPQARWYQYEPISRDNQRAGAQLAFGRELSAVYNFEQADVVVALDADFMTNGPASVRYQRDFMNRRRVRSTEADVNRLYVVETTMTVTGSKADHRLPLRSSQVADVARAIAAGVGVGGVQAANLPEQANAWVAGLVQDLQSRSGRAVVVPGDRQPPVVHALAHAINDALGSVGTAVRYIEPVEALPPQAGTLQDLANEIDAGQVQVLAMIDVNPAFTAPADLDFAAKLANVPLSIHMGLFEDETGAASTWHVPKTHFLEEWSDARAFEGTTTIIQPLIAPLYQSHSAHELLGVLVTGQSQPGDEIVRNFWQSQNSGGNFDTFWEQVLLAGVVPDTAAEDAAGPSVQANFDTQPAQAGSADALELAIYPDETIWDGSFANNGWLQELPKPITKITWDNVALVSPNTAQQLDLQNQDVVRLTSNGRSVDAPVWIQPGQADGTVVIQLGYGRTRAGRVGNNIGYNAYALRTVAAPWFAGDLQVEKTGGTYEIACTQDHFSMEGRFIARDVNVEEYNQDPMLLHHHEEPHYSLYPERQYTGYAWGMAIDLNVCTGCNACVMACQAENNSPVVGKEEVLRGREMQWLRIDRYFEGSLDNPRVHHQPLMCVHCENAPCEVVCPVAATVHDAEGLNNMVYNRCVGTKYCSNNCPFKVRRFNFLQYSDETTESLKLMRNPDVTVRVRGVMEKCTYCVQRINEVRQYAEAEGRRIGDGEVVTACQAACPTQAIVFGDINDAASQVAQVKRLPLSYTLLNELNVKPRTSYLASVWNPNPELEA